ncbi:MAG: DUF4065 domain-containing protein [Bacteroidia bacterium]|nr:DUF4065 domain-containing protein [Bacteroidia bacterium]
MQPLSSTEIGQRLALLRKRKGLSQEELSTLMGISRPSLTQIELGNRNLSLSEIQMVGEIFAVSIDRLLAPDFSLPEANLEETNQTLSEKIRISVPQMQVSKFREVLLYILEKCAGKPNVGETLLNKLLYFSDFNYYEQYEEHLSGAAYRKLPFGPVPQNLETILHQMIEDQAIQRLKTHFHGYPQTRYIPLAKADLTQLKASEKDVLDKVIEQFSDWSATAISEYSHHDMPWLATENGEIIDYELAFYREAPYSVRNYRLRKSQKN